MNSQVRGAYGFFKKARHHHGSGLVHSDYPRIAAQLEQILDPAGHFQKEKRAAGSQQPL